MKKLGVLMTVLALTIALGLAGYAKQSQSNGERAGAQAEVGSPYRGGSGGGSDSCEYVGPLDNSKLDNSKIEPKKSEGEKSEGGLGDLLRRWFKRK